MRVSIGPQKKGQMTQMTNNDTYTVYRVILTLRLSSKGVEAVRIAADDAGKNAGLAAVPEQVPDRDLGGDNPVPTDLVHVETSRGPGKPQCFKVMRRYLPKRWFEYFFGDGEGMSYRDRVVVHEISAEGLSTDEMEILRKAELASAIDRIAEDPACRPLLRSILTKAIGEGALDEFDARR